MEIGSILKTDRATNLVQSNIFKNGIETDLWRIILKKENSITDPESVNGFVFDFRKNGFILSMGVKLTLAKTSKFRSDVCTLHQFWPFLLKKSRLDTQDIIRKKSHSSVYFETLSKYFCHTALKFYSTAASTPMLCFLSDSLWA